jgi:hypothetical protein
MEKVVAKNAGHRMAFLLRRRWPSNKNAPFAAKTRQVIVTLPGVGGQSAAADPENVPY